MLSHLAFPITSPSVAIAATRHSFVTREEDINLLRSHERTGRALGDEEFLADTGTRAGKDAETSKARPQGKARELGVVSPDPARKYAKPGPSWIRLNLSETLH